MNEKIENIEEYSLLYDFYGEFLPGRQAEFYRLYHDENLSFVEIAARAGISRQGVFDAVKKAEKALENYENKLGLVASYLKGH